MNQQEKEQLWRALGNTGDVPVGWNGPGGNSGTTLLQGQANSIAQPRIEEVEKYVAELIAQAQGDYDYAAKIIEREFGDAMGTNDATRKEFLKQVANDLEAKIGTVAYDYQTGTYRSKQDVEREVGQLEADKQLGLGRTEEDRSTVVGRTEDARQRALSRLKEDETVQRQQLDRESSQIRKSQGETLNQRGILTGTRDEAQGLAGQEVRSVEEELKTRYDAIARAAGRTTEDTNLQADQTITDTNRTAGRQSEDIARTADRGISSAQLTGQRYQEDLTTEARRAASGAEQEKIDALEAEKRRLEKQKQNAEIEKKRETDIAKSTALNKLYGMGGGGPKPKPKSPTRKKQDSLADYAAMLRGIR